MSGHVRDILNFTAIDFETAGYSRDSACSVGVAVVRDGVIVDTYHSLLKPPQGYVEDKFTGIHGITTEQVSTAPSFADVWPQVQRRCDHGLVAAHNSSFDLGVAKACSSLMHDPWLPKYYLCTCRMAQNVLPGLPNHKLHTLAKLFGLKLQHHHAESDAIACAEIGIRLFSLAGPSLLEEQCREMDEFGSDNDYSHKTSTASRLNFWV